MKLPSHVLTKLYAVTILGAASCEPADRTECKPVVEDRVTPLDEVVRTSQYRPAAAPPLAAPAPQPHQPPPPPPTIEPRPKRQVWASVCGHAHLVDEKALLAKCGKG